MSRRVSPDIAPSVFSLGYNKATAYRATHVMPLFGGSSLNRKKKNENKIAKEKTPAIGETTNQNTEQENALHPLHADSSTERPNLRKGLPATVKRKKYVFRISPKSAGKIRDKFAAFYRSSSGQAILATLSFINSVTDETGIAVLNKFLTVLRKKHKKLNYIWVAERQQNGNIHFHLVINKRIPVTDFNALWVLQQYNAGIRFGNVSMEEINVRYEKKTIGEILNPLDVKKINSIDGLSLYLTKYLTKSTAAFKCRPWHCSRGVSRLFTKALTHKSTFELTATDKNSYVNKKTGELFEAKTFVSEHAVCRFILNKKFFSSYLSEIEQINAWMLTGKIKVDEVPTITIEDYYKQFVLN